MTRVRNAQQLLLYTDMKNRRHHGALRLHPAFPSSTACSINSATPLASQFRLNRSAGITPANNYIQLPAESRRGPDKGGILTPKAPPAAHGGLRQSLRSTRLGTGRAGRRQGCFKILGGIRRVALALCCAKMHGFATASFFPGLFFYFFAFSTT